MKPATFYSATYDSPLGVYMILSSSNGVVCIASENETAEWLEHFGHAGKIRTDNHGNAPVVKQLASYFAGKLTTFDIILDLRGTTFQVAVWQALCGVPYGETRSYKDIAVAIGRPQATRPVGGAVGANPVSIVVPCHRIIGTDRSLTGYGGELWRKKALLALEAQTLHH